MISPPSQSPPATRPASLVLSLPHSYDRFRAFEHSDSPAQLSEPAETERRRATFTHSDNPAKLSEPAETERRRVTLKHSHAPRRNSPFSPLPFRPYTIIRAKSHSPKGVPRPYHARLLHRRPVDDQPNPRWQYHSSAQLFGCRLSHHHPLRSS